MFLIEVSFSSLPLSKHQFKKHTYGNHSLMPTECRRANEQLSLPMEEGLQALVLFFVFPGRGDPREHLLLLQGARVGMIMATVHLVLVLSQVPYTAYVFSLQRHKKLIRYSHYELAPELFSHGLPPPLPSSALGQKTSYHLTSSFVPLLLGGQDHSKPRALPCTHWFLVSKKRLERSPNPPPPPQPPSTSVLGLGGTRMYSGCVHWSLVPDSLRRRL